MRLLYINPNSTESMTDQVTAVARGALPEAEVLGWTNHAGPPAIQGPEDGAAAVVGLMAMLPQAAEVGADVIIIACFDDTGLDDLRAAAHCPVIGIGQAAYVTAALAYGGFAVVTTLQVSVPVLEENIARYGLSPACTAVLASGLPVLTVEQGGEAVLSRLSDSITAAVAGGAKAVALGCAGMAHLRADLMARTSVPLVDGVAASAHLARALVLSLR
jgi:allantoin racemase